MAPGKLLGRLLIVVIVSLFDAIDDVDADDGIQWLGDACHDDDDCHDAFNLLCVRGQCICKQGFVSAQFSCHPASPLGGECTYHAQCQYSDSHSACDLTGHCACVDGFRPRRDTLTTKKCAAEEADDDDRQYPDAAAVARPHAITGMTMHSIPPLMRSPRFFRRPKNNQRSKVSGRILPIKIMSYFS
ncbi:uncharacterized protein LOC119388210 [Rhipicephalus sanguineus]|uniref:uncharacterized protein LOC119388210 n=1 Tax=Rhipicephalus sanguineus TaxID=34632 RepID=UPI0020C48623|nr:uncharacterized protein LOC119388210 [Rhipicephalus sanguineus]